MDTSYLKAAWDRRLRREFLELSGGPAAASDLAGAVVRREMTEKLRSQGDPRMFGNGDVFDRYAIANEAVRSFYERYMSGEKVKAPWVNDSDFEKAPLP